MINVRAHLECYNALWCEEWNGQTEWDVWSGAPMIRMMMMMVMIGWIEHIRETITLLHIFFVEFMENCSMELGLNYDFVYVCRQQIHGRYWSSKWNHRIRHLTKAFARLAQLKLLHFPSRQMVNLRNANAKWEEKKNAIHIHIHELFHFTIVCGLQRLHESATQLFVECWKL